jgi:hypothetical protein
MPTMPTPKEDNPLWLLRTFYFVPCDLMHQNVNLLKGRAFADENPENADSQEVFISFLLYWLGGLFVVIEGWKSLKITEPTIDKMIDEHWDSLRQFRNAVFHFQPDDRKHVQFFDLAKFNWAEELHAALRAFFEAQESR